jgi:mannose-6-phosphate isomerase class I
VDQALDVIDYAAGPVSPRPAPRPDAPECERLVECDKFVLERRQTEDPQVFGGDERFHILALLGGRLDVLGQVLQLGDVTLLPAAAGPVTAVPNGRAVVLDIFLP